MSKTEKVIIPSYESLVTQKPADLAILAKQTVKLDKAVSTAKTQFTESLHTSSKLVSAMRTQYTKRVEDRDIPGDTSFKEYFEQNAGGKLPGRVEALAGLFTSLVLTLDANGKPLLAESCFDSAAVDWLEKANAIVNAAKKKFGDTWKTCDDVLDVVNALSKPGDALKTLKEIRKRQKGETEEEAAETALPLTVDRAVAFILAAIGVATPENGRSLFIQTLQIANAWEKSPVNEDTLNTWTKEYLKAVEAGANPEMKIVTPEPALQAA